MGIFEANGHCGANGHLGTDGYWSKWALGANELWGEMGIRKSEHQSKWAFMRQMGTVEQIGALGPMDMGAILGN